MRSSISSLNFILRIVAITAGAFVLFGSVDAALGHGVATYAVQCLVLVYVWSLVGQSLRNPRQLVLLRGIRPRHFMQALLLLAATLGAIIALLIPHTFLRWGWWDSLGGNGSVILGQATGAASLLSRVVLPALIVVALLLCLCGFALREERLFRRGDEQRHLGTRLWRSLLFGLAHLVMGIPIGAAIGLGVGGFGFSQVYLNRWRASRSRYRSVLDSTRVHVVYNLILIGLVIVLLIAASRSSPGARTT
jgi:hypothetical protein